MGRKFGGGQPISPWQKSVLSGNQSAVAQSTKAIKVLVESHQAQLDSFRECGLVGICE